MLCRLGPCWWKPHPGPRLWHPLQHPQMPGLLLLRSGCLLCAQVGVLAGGAVGAAACGPPGALVGESMGRNLNRVRGHGAPKWKARPSVQQRPRPLGARRPGLAFRACSLPFSPLLLRCAARRGQREGQVEGASRHGGPDASLGSVSHRHPGGGHRAEERGDGAAFWKWKAFCVGSAAQVTYFGVEVMPETGATYRLQKRYNEFDALKDRLARTFSGTVP